MHERLVLRLVYPDRIEAHRNVRSPEFEMVAMALMALGVIFVSGVLLVIGYVKSRRPQPRRQPQLQPQEQPRRADVSQRREAA